MTRRGACAESIPAEKLFAIASRAAAQIPGFRTTVFFSRLYYRQRPAGERMALDPVHHTV
jgi:hypothetical protein